MKTTTAQHQLTDDLSLVPLRRVFHRPLTSNEIQTIWALLNPPSLPNTTQEIHITLKQDTEAPHSGWIIQIGQPSRGGAGPLVSIACR